MGNDLRLDWWMRGLDKLYGRLWWWRELCGRFELGFSDKAVSFGWWRGLCDRFGLGLFGKSVGFGWSLGLCGGFCMRVLERMAGDQNSRACLGET